MYLQIWNQLWKNSTSSQRHLLHRQEPQGPAKAVQNLLKPKDIYNLKASPKDTLWSSTILSDFKCFKVQLNRLVQNAGRRTQDVGRRKDI